MDYDGKFVCSNGTQCVDEIDECIEYINDSECTDCIEGKIPSLDEETYIIEIINYTEYITQNICNNYENGKDKENIYDFFYYLYTFYANNGKYIEFDVIKYYHQSMCNTNY